MACTWPTTSDSARARRRGGMSVSRLWFEWTLATRLLLEGRAQTLLIITGIVAYMTIGGLLGPRRPEAEKLSPYECGFNAFDDARMKFDVRFYLVSILFIIFDLEIAFLFPWAVSLHEIGPTGFWAAGSTIRSP